MWIQLWHFFARNLGDMLSDWSPSAKPVETLVHHVSILNIPTHISGGGSFINASRKSLPAGSKSSLFKFRAWPIFKVTNCVVCKAFDMIRSIPHDTLVSHWIWVWWVIVGAVIDIQTDLFLVPVISVVSHIWNNELWRGGTANTSAVPCIAKDLSAYCGLIIRCHFILVHGWCPRHRCTFEHLIEPLNQYFSWIIFSSYFLASPSSLFTLYYQARCWEWYDMVLQLIFINSNLFNFTTY